MIYRAMDGLLPRKRSLEFLLYRFARRNVQGYYYIHERIARIRHMYIYIHTHLDLKIFKKQPFPSFREQ